MKDNAKLDDILFSAEFDSRQLRNIGMEYSTSFADLQIYRKGDYAYAFEQGQEKLQLYIKYYVASNDMQLNKNSKL